MIALIDCNNFFVSCERVFNPQLKEKPVLVLSGTGGCIIARSNEAKKLGFTMGQPFHLIEHLIEKHKVYIFSTNFTLYASMSNRIMRIISDEIEDFEIYSVDEAFLNLSRYKNPNDVCHKLRAKILKWTGIPVSIGIASSKTLAKVAASIAKKSPSGVFLLQETEREKILQNLPIEDIWGIGYQWSKQLRLKGINSAYDLISKPDGWLRKSLKVIGLRTATELRGEPCYDLKLTHSAKKGITVSRSFTRRLKTLQEMEEAIASFATTAAIKLRKECRLTRYILPFIATNKFDKTQVYYKNSILVGLEAATNFTPDIIKAAKAGVKQIFREGLHYKKCGVHLIDLIDEQTLTQDLFAPAQSAQQQKLMQLLDHINSQYGKDTLKFAAASGKEIFTGHNQLRSTWNGILQVKL
ncbi:MAG: DUF4113 domain-containing protein [Rickettsiales bacterium]